MAQTVDISAFLLNKLKKNYQSSYLKKFGSLKTNLERVNFVYKDLLENCPDYPPFKKDEKSDAKAVEIRETGNMCFGLGKYREALRHYTISILTAKSNGVLSLAYANRSAALYKLNLYKECLMDIERALHHGYPDHLKPKLIERQRHAKAQKSVDEKYYEEVPKIPLSKKNPLIECAADNVKIVRTQQYGRAVIATRDIQIGEIIAIEKPYAAVGENKVYLHCHECMELCYNLIPCNICTRALYCSVQCKDQAFNYHHYECPILLTLDSFILDFSTMEALKIALKIIFLSKNELEQSTNSYEIEENEIYRSNRFKEVYNIEGHSKKRIVMSIFCWTTVAARVFHLIKNHTRFLQDGMNEDCLKHFLLSLSLKCCANTVQIEELTPDQTPDDIMMTYSLKSLGTGIYTFFTLLNHSCWPNIIRQFHGNIMVMRAVNTIKEGEQCFVCYGPNYLDDSKEIRQNILADHFFFKCTCPACERNWPIRDVLHVQEEWQFDWFLTTVKLSGADVNLAKEELPRLLSKAKILEKKLPPGRDYVIKDMLSFCYDIFGNKRRI